MIHTKTKCNTSYLPLFVSSPFSFYCSRFQAHTWFSTPWFSTPSVCVVCVFAPVSLHEAGVEASRHWGLGIAYPKTVESSPQDSINQSRLISFDTTLSAAEVANYHTQWLHHDLLYSPYDACAFCPPLVNQQKMNHQLLISNCSSKNARNVLFPGCPVRICCFSKENNMQIGNNLFLTSLLSCDITWNCCSLSTRTNLIL